jgi:hypothetical protein
MMTLTFIHHLQAAGERLAHLVDLAVLGDLVVVYFQVVEQLGVSKK